MKNYPLFFRMSEVFYRSVRSDFLFPIFYQEKGRLTLSERILFLLAREGWNGLHAITQRRSGRIHYHGEQLVVAHNTDGVDDSLFTELGDHLFVRGITNALRSE